MTKKTIYLIRHGETDMNRKECLQGQIDSELNETGIAEAQKTAAILKRNGIEFDKAYSSPLKRAMKTAEMIVPGMEINAEPLIKEMHFGHYEGMPYNRIDETMWRFIHNPENVAPPEGVESVKSLTDRTGRFLENILSDSFSGNILVTTHGIALRSMLWNLYDDKRRHSVWSMPIENCVVYKLEAEDGKVTGIRKADELSLKNESDTSAAF